jgi:hypothetical protein
MNKNGSFYNSDDSNNNVGRKEYESQWLSKWEEGSSPRLWRSPRRKPVVFPCGPFLCVVMLVRQPHNLSVAVLPSFHGRGSDGNFVRCRTDPSLPIRITVEPLLGNLGINQSSNKCEHIDRVYICLILKSIRNYLPGSFYPIHPWTLVTTPWPDSGISTSEKYHSIFLQVLQL